MKKSRDLRNRRILFGVTSSQSLALLGDIPRGMAKFGWDVHVVAGDKRVKVPAELEGVEVHTVSMVRNPSLARDITSLVRWIVVIKSINPGIVVIGTPKAATLGLLAAMICRIPVRVYHLRGLRLETVVSPARQLLYLIERITARSATHILAVSLSLKQKYCELKICDREKIEVIGCGSSHGVDTSQFHPTRWAGAKIPELQLDRLLESQNPILGFVGRFSRNKGSKELLKACRDLTELGIAYSLLIVGNIEGGREELQKLQLLNDSIIIAGQVSSVAPLYSLMDVLVLPTHREGFPNVVLEAAASGVPAITTDATGAIDSVVHGVTGLIVPTGNADALAGALKSLINDPEFRRKLGKNARNRATYQFETKTVTAKHIEYLNQLT